MKFYWVCSNTQSCRQGKSGHRLYDLAIYILFDDFSTAVDNDKINRLDGYQCYYLMQQGDEQFLLILSSIYNSTLAT
jgi:hypothetical protein